MEIDPITLRLGCFPLIGRTARRDGGGAECRDEEREGEQEMEKEDNQKRDG